MADLKISELAPVGTLTGDEIVPVVQSSGNRRATLDQVQTFVREIDPTDAEIAAGATVVRKNFDPGDVSRYCSAAETNHQQAFDDAHAANDVIYAPAGTWNVDHFLIDIDGRKLRTDGFATIIKQRTGNINRRTIEVCASNVIIDDIKVEGNIATDTGEQQFGVFVSGDHPTEVSRDIRNIHIGNVWGEGLRGDVLYLGAPAGFSTTEISFGVIRGTNIYRNVVSIVGASYIKGVGVTTDGGCGYATFDIEPNAGGTPSTDIIVDWVRGGVLQIASPTAATLAQRIRVLVADLDPAYQPNSTPGYSEGVSSYALEIINAVWLRNCVDVYIGHLKVRDHANFAMKYVWNSGETEGRGIHIGYLDSSGVGASESTINGLLEVANVETLTIDDGDVALQSTNDFVIVGPSATKNLRVDVGRLRVNGKLVRFCKDSTFNQLEVNFAHDAQVFRECENITVLNSTVVSGRLASDVAGATFIGVNATCNGANYLATVTNASLINCSGGLASILAGSATYDPGSLADGAGVTTTVTATGAALGDFAQATFSLDLQGITLTAWVSAANTVSVRFQNESTGTIDLASGTLRVRVQKA